MNRKCLLAGVALTALVLLATLIVYPHLPSRVPSHWNAQDQVDRYAPRWTLIVYMPAAMLAITVVFAFLPWLSPKQFEVDSFRSTYVYIAVIVLIMMAYIHAVGLWAVLSGRVHITRAIIGAICLLVALMGNVMGKVRRNFYIGVRTPWTLANEHVWNATHRFAAKTFVIGGVAGLVLSVLGAQFWLAFASLLVGALVPVFYSLVIYKRLEAHGEL